MLVAAQQQQQQQQQQAQMHSSAPSSAASSSSAGRRLGPARASSPLAGAPPPQVRMLQPTVNGNSHLEIIASSRPASASSSTADWKALARHPTSVANDQAAGRLGPPPPRPPRAPAPASSLSTPLGALGPALLSPSASSSRSASPASGNGRRLVPKSAKSSSTTMGRPPLTAAALPGAPPLLLPTSTSAGRLAPASAASQTPSRPDASSQGSEDGPPGQGDDDDDDSDASSFHDEELVDLGSSSEDEFLALPAVVVRSGALGESESSAESLGRVLGGPDNGKGPQPPVRDWLGAPGLPPSTTATAPAVSSALARPPRTSSFPSLVQDSPSVPVRAQRAGSNGPGALAAAEGSHSRTPSMSEKLRRELPALHTTFGGPPTEQHQLPASSKEREHQLHQQQQHGGPRSAVASPPPYAHTPTSARPAHAAADDETDDSVHAHRDGYTNSPSLFRLPDLGPSSSSGGGRLLSPLGGASVSAGPNRSHARAPSDGKLFDPSSFTLGSHSASSPKGLVGLLACSSSSSSSSSDARSSSSGKRALRAVLDELAIQDVFNLFSALGQQGRRELEASSDAVEELRVWALGWAGYVRGALEVAHGREGWDRIGWAVILDFLSAMLEPPTTAYPPGQVLSISLTTLLLRASHAIRPPAGPHLIPFEEEDVLPPPLQPTLAALNPKTRMRGLPAGRLLVLPSPLAAQPQQQQQQQHQQPASASAFGLSGSQSAIDGRNGSFPPPAKGSVRSRRSSISEAVGLHWGGGSSRARASAAHMGGAGGPPSAFGGLNQQQALPLKLAPSSASIYSVDNHSKAKLAPPPPRLPEPRRYEFPQPAGVGASAGRQHRRQASDSQSVMSSAGTLSFGGHAPSSMGFHPHSVHRPRGVSAGPSATSASSSSQMLAPSVASGVSSPDLSNGHRSWLAELNAAPPVPAFAQPLRKSSSKDGSWTSLGAGSSSARGGGSHSASASLLGGGRWDTASSSESSSGQMTRRRSDEAPLAEPLFLSLTSPYRFGRAPIIKIVVPFPADVVWPSGPALKLCHRHLDATGLLAKLRLGDLVENLAVSWRSRKKEGPAGASWTTGTMVFIPPYLHPLSTTHASLPPAGASPATAVPSPSSSKTAVAASSSVNKAAHLPASLNMFLLPPTYYHSVVPPPYIIYLDLTPFAGRVTETLRLANQRAEVLSAGGDVLSLDQWVHEAGFFVEETGAGGPWEGTMVTLEADGTKEGKDEILRRVDCLSAKRRPWEVVAAKSTRGSVWLKLVRETLPSAA